MSAGGVPTHPSSPHPGKCNAAFRPILMIPEVPPGLAVPTIQLPAQCLTTGEISASWDKAFEPLLALPAIWCQVLALEIWSNLSSTPVWLCDLAVS